MKTPTSPSSQRPGKALLLLTGSIAAILALPSAASAVGVAFTWSGDIDGNWATLIPGPPQDTNWTSNTLPGASDLLTFTGTSNTSTFNNLPADTLYGNVGTTNAITFDNLTTAGQFTLAGNRITLNGNILSTGTTGTPTHTISLDMILNGARTVQPIGSNNINISGIISETGGSQSFAKNGAGDSTFSGVNTFTGQLIVQQGTLNIATIADGGTASNAGAGTSIRFGNNNATGTLNYTGTGSSTNRTVQIGSGIAVGNTGGAVINSAGTGALVFTAPSFNTVATGATAPTRLLTLGGANTGANEIQGIIANGSGTTVTAVTKTGAGIWTLSGVNTFTDLLVVQQGTLNIATIADAGAASNAGAGSSIRFGNANTNATLNYTGTGSSTNRTVQIGNGTGTGGGTITNNGTTGALVFTAGNFNITGAAVGTATAARTLTLGGSNVADNEISGVIADGGSGAPATAVTKINAGKWVLSGANTYTGATTLNNNGILEIRGSINGTASVAINTNTRLFLAGAGGEQVNDAAAIQLGGGTLRFTNAANQIETLGLLSQTVDSALDFGLNGGNDSLIFAGVGTHTAGTILTITNWVGNTAGGTTGVNDRLIFNGSSSAFTSTYLNPSDVVFTGIGPGYGVIELGGSYEIVAIPEPASAALLGTSALLVLAGYRGRRRRKGEVLS